MENLPLPHMIGSALWFIAQLSVILFCLILLIKRPSLAAILMFCGMVLSLIFGSLGFLIFPLLGESDPESVLRTQGVLSILGSLAFMIFAIGLLLLVLRVIKTPS